MHTTTQGKVTVSRLRDVLSGMGHEIKHSQCLEVISSIEEYPDWNTHPALLNRRQNIAEQYLDEVLESEDENRFEKFIQRCEKNMLSALRRLNF